MIPDPSALDALRKLATDPLLGRLESHVPGLSLFDLLGCARDELAHSRVIATLFNPARHRQAGVALRSFAKALVEKLKHTHPEISASFRQIISAPWTRVRVRRELVRIDITAEICSPAGNAIIGIENKIDAAEQPEQIARYQAALAAAFPCHVAVVAFLSASQRTPETLNPTSTVPCVAIDYSVLAAAAMASLEVAAPDSADVPILGEIVRHLKEDFMPDQLLRKLVRELWNSHPRALQLAVMHRPRIADVQNAYTKYLGNQLGEDAVFKKYPNKGDLREIKMSLKSWKRVGLPFTFMFYATPTEPPQVRLLITSDAYEKGANHLQDWARSVNAAAGTLIDEGFRPLGGWSFWRRVFLEEEYPEAAALEARGFDEGTVREAARRVLAMIETLRPHVPLGA